MAFILPFETEIHALDEQLATLPRQDSGFARRQAALEKLEREVYPSLSAYEKFLLSGHPLRPKTLDYVQHIFRDVRLFYNPDVRGDHLMIGGEGKIDIDGRSVDVIIIGQQTGPSSRLNELLRLSKAEYERWNQGMGFPDSYRKAVYFMEVAEERGWPVVVFVDTPGADPSEYSEEQGQAFAINEVIHKTTSLRVPNLSYIISAGASGGAIAVTPTNRTIMNQYATYMVISPGGCASILFRNRRPESIRAAAESLRLTSADALRQGTVDDVVEEGLHPGHRYPGELLAAGREAVVRNIAQILDLNGPEAESERKAKFFAMGVWGRTDGQRSPDALARLARKHDRNAADLREALGQYLAYLGDEPSIPHADRSESTSTGNAEVKNRAQVARLIYAVMKHDSSDLQRMLGRPVGRVSAMQWGEILEFVLSRRYARPLPVGSMPSDHQVAAIPRPHPVDWIRHLADADSFREFDETIDYCSIDQLQFPDYEEALDRGTASSGLQSGLITGRATIRGHPAVLAVNNFRLVGSSLCDEIGEKFRHAANQALKTRIPLVSAAMGGGARMQEGTPSMHRNIPKAQHALNELEEAGIPHISVIADPTLGGTAISYGLRGDYMIVVEGSANIGFSGKRVVEQFQRRKVAPGFQHGAWLMHRGFVDERITIDRLADRLAELFQHAAEGVRIAGLRARRPRSWVPAEEITLETLPASSFVGTARD